MIHINYRDSRPIYEQIRENLLKLITTGVLPPNEKLPSVRELASDLAINPNTIQRAYRELENEGYIYKVSGRGTFVSDTADIGKSRREELFTGLEASIRELLAMSVPEETILARVQSFLRSTAAE